MTAARTEPSGVRDVVSYALQRRATLAALRSGALAAEDACDAQPYLRRAATHLGEQSERLCPVCRRERLLQITYVYGDELGQFSGRVRSSADVAALAAAHGELRVFVVEVCAGPLVVPGAPELPRIGPVRDWRRPGTRPRQRGCGWNSLVLSYVVGDGVARRPPRRQPTIEDEL
ncbi:hypothetical protein EV189_0413 [Motilibacter rhizosphaerae]|uniref:Uncharacterized protein n=1 Tax=Motilibacter rhizosphaerae TaxID=598652 RepID=A0A4V2F509_9ACTN|nr:DUF5318 family protein [Motilibacter rhizosphaerae]RZS91179.1 hypothetical protein EV189_0413 [Motilibacter rhizosphaerae]